MTRPASTVNDARAILASLRDTKPQIRLQREIVRDHADAIITMIRDDGATKEEVADVIKEMGEPVLPKGFDAEVRRQLGTVKDIRQGRVVTESGSRPKDPVTEPTDCSGYAGSVFGRKVIDDDYDEDSPFAARRPRA